MHIYVCVIIRKRVGMFLPKTVAFKKKAGLAASEKEEGTPNRKLSLCNADVKRVTVFI